MYKSSENLCLTNGRGLAPLRARGDPPRPEPQRSRPLRVRAGRRPERASQRPAVATRHYCPLSVSTIRFNRPQTFPTATSGRGGERAPSPPPGLREKQRPRRPPQRPPAAPASHWLRARGGREQVAKQPITRGARRASAGRARPAPSLGGTVPPRPLRGRALPGLATCLSRAQCPARVVRPPPKGALSTRCRSAVAAAGDT